MLFFGGGFFDINIFGSITLCMGKHFIPIAIGKLKKIVIMMVKCGFLRHPKRRSLDKYCSNGF
jgi:hypothetical protein